MIGFEEDAGRIPTCLDTPVEAAGGVGSLGGVTFAPAVPGGVAPFDSERAASGCFFMLWDFLTRTEPWLRGVVGPLPPVIVPSVEVLPNAFVPNAGVVAFLWWPGLKAEPWGVCWA